LAWPTEFRRCEGPRDSLCTTRFAPPPTVAGIDFSPFTRCFYLFEFFPQTSRFFPPLVRTAIGKSDKYLPIRCSIIGFLKQGRKDALRVEEPPSEIEGRHIKVSFKRVLVATSVWRRGPLPAQNRGRFAGLFLEPLKGLGEESSMFFFRTYLKRNSSKREQACAKNTLSPCPNPPKSLPEAC